MAPIKTVRLVNQLKRSHPTHVFGFTLAMVSSYPFCRCRDFESSHRRARRCWFRWFVCLFFRRLYSLSISLLVGLAAFEQKPIKAYEIIGSALDPAASVAKDRILTVSKLLSPLSNEEVKVVRCLGLNYSDHAVRLFHLKFHI